MLPIPALGFCYLLSITVVSIFFIPCPLCTEASYFRIRRDKQNWEESWSNHLRIATKNCDHTQTHRDSHNYVHGHDQMNFSLCRWWYWCFVHHRQRHPSQSIAHISTNRVRHAKEDRNGKAKQILYFYLSQECVLFVILPSLSITRSLSFFFSGSPFRDEISLAVLQLQENNRLEILKRRWWEGGQCPKEEDHRAKGMTIHIPLCFRIHLCVMSICFTVIHSGLGFKQNRSKYCVCVLVCWFKHKLSVYFFLYVAGLGMENIGGIFVVLICGLIIAVFVAVMEFVWSTRRSAETDEVWFLSAHVKGGYHSGSPLHIRYSCARYLPVFGIMGL